MSNINIAAEVCAFVEYKIRPIPITFKGDIYNALMEEVWGVDGDVDEDIRVFEDYLMPGQISIVRYQYRDVGAASERSQWISELIASSLERWCAKNSHELER